MPQQSLWCRPTSKSNLSNNESSRKEFIQQSLYFPPGPSTALFLPLPRAFLKITNLFLKCGSGHIQGLHQYSDTYHVVKRRYDYTLKKEKSIAWPLTGHLSASSREAELSGAAWILFSLQSYCKTNQKKKKKFMNCYKPSNRQVYKFYQRTSF